jgi:AsmA protein
MKMARILGGVVGGIAVLLGLALGLVWLSVDPDHYKTQIETRVREATGRELHLAGPVRLALFPWVALELGPASLGNPPGFGPGEFLSFSHAAVRLKLWPLLSHRVAVAGVEVDGLDLHLARDAQGRGNWQRVGGVGGGANAVGGAAAPQDVRAWLGAAAPVHVMHGRVSYQAVVVSNLDLETGSAGEGQRLPVNLRFEATRGVPGESIAVDARLDVSADAGGHLLQVAAVNLSGTLARPGEDRPAHWEMGVPSLDYAMAAQTLAVPAFNLSYSSIRLTGSVNAEIKGAVRATGSVTLAPLLLQEVAPRLPFPLPATRDPKALSEFAFSGEFMADEHGVQFEHVKARLDQTNVTGRAAYTRGDAAQIEFELAADRVDLDRYRAPVGGAGAGAGAGHAGAGSGSESAGDAAPSPGSPDGAGRAPGQALAVAGTLTVGALQVGSLGLSDLKVVVAHHDQVTRLHPLDAQLAGGRYAGDITWDQRGAVPTLSVESSLSGADLGALLGGSSRPQHVSGHALVNLNVHGSGARGEALLQSLTGQAAVKVADGAIEGVDVGYELERAQSLLERRRTAGAADSHRTPFDTVTMSVQISDGVAVTHDLTLSSAAFRVTGEGSVNLASQALDMQLIASLLKSPSTKGVDIPLRVTGTYTDPRIKPELAAAAKDLVKQKLKEVLKKNGLGGLFK